MGDSENQQLTETKPNKGGRPKGSKTATPFHGRTEVHRAVKRINAKLAEAGRDYRVDPRYNVLSRMVEAAIEEDIHQAGLPEGERDSRLLFGMLKEIVPYTHRKLAPEPVKEDADEKKSDGVADLLSLVRDAGDQQRKLKVIDHE